MAGQLLAIIGLKWALLRNTWTSGKLFSLVVMAVLAALGACLALALSVGMFYLGKSVLGSRAPQDDLLMLDAMLFVFIMFWMWGLLFELQRSDVIDFRKMLFLPVSPRMVFLLNYLASFFSPALLFFAPAAAALVLGISARVGLFALLGIPIAALYFCMLAAWSYYVRGLLAVVMENKRRRRMILAVLPLGFIVLGQLPNIMTRTFLGGEDGNKEQLKQRVEQAAPYMELANVALPPAWLAYGIWAVQEQKPVAAGAISGAMGLLTALGLGLGYRSTLRYYSGAESGGRSPAKPRQGSPGARTEAKGMPATARRFPAMEEDTAAMTWAAFLSYARHPNIRMLMIMPLALGFFFLFMYGNREFQNELGWGASWMPMAVLLWPFFNYAFVMFNIFGIDQQGFRGMMLLPAPRYKYLLAKNLALFPFVAGLASLFVLLGAFLFDTSPGLVGISLLQVVQLYFLFCVVGNFVSLYFPYRLSRDAMRARPNKAIIYVVGPLSALLMALLMIPASLCLLADSFVQARYGDTALPVGLVLSVILLALTLGIYWMSLTPAGDVMTTREQRILATLSKGAE